jgi:hypothetical protein
VGNALKSRLIIHSGVRTGRGDPARGERVQAGVGGGGVRGRRWRG